MARFARWLKQASAQLPIRLLRLVRDHAVSTLLLLFCIGSLFGQGIAGYLILPASAHARPILNYFQFLTSGDFLETVAENWEGEFLPLSLYVLLTSILIERGAKESRDPDKATDPTDVEPDEAGASQDKRIPWPARAGGPIGWLYAHSLFTAFFLLFLISFTLHAITGVGVYRSSLQQFNRAGPHYTTPVISILEYMGTATFWLQSLRNWQAGFLSTALLAIFSIFLRQKGSPVSKTLTQSNKDTGEPDEPDDDATAASEQEQEPTQRPVPQ